MSFSPSPTSRTAQPGAGSKYRGADKDFVGFFVLCNGQIESGDLEGEDNLYCDFEFTQGQDWQVIQGLHHGTSQVSKIGPTSDGNVVWNMPFDVTYKSTNAFGWPRMVVSVYGFDMFGRNIVHGYGTLLVPTVPGRYERTVRLFAPVSSSKLQEFVAWLTGNRPEFWESSFVAQGKGREVTRVKTKGKVRVQINVLTRGMNAHGFNSGGPIDGILSTDIIAMGNRSSTNASVARPGTASGLSSVMGGAGRTSSGWTAAKKSLASRTSGGLTALGATGGFRPSSAVARGPAPTPQPRETMESKAPDVASQADKSGDRDSTTRIAPVSRRSRANRAFDISSATTGDSPISQAADNPLASTSETNADQVEKRTRQSSIGFSASNNTGPGRRERRRAARGAAAFEEEIGNTAELESGHEVGKQPDEDDAITPLQSVNKMSVAPVDPIRPEGSQDDDADSLGKLQNRRLASRRNRPTMNAFE